MKAPAAGFIDGGQPSTSRSGGKNRYMAPPEPPSDWMDSQMPQPPRSAGDVTPSSYTSASSPKRERMPRWRGEHPDDLLLRGNSRHEDFPTRGDPAPHQQPQGSKRRKHKGNMYMGIKDDHMLEKESVL